MAKQSEEKKHEANGNGEDEAPSRFREIITERYMFNANKCYADLPQAKRLALVGFLVNVLDMPVIKGREWQAYCIHTTEPVHALNRDKEVIEVPAGNHVLIPATHQLQSFLGKAANFPQGVYEVMIRPDRKVPIGGGQTMWVYKLAANPRVLPRAKFGVAALLNQASEPGTAPMLPGSDTNGDLDDDVPFS